VLPFIGDIATVKPDAVHNDVRGRHVYSAVAVAVAVVTPLYTLLHTIVRIV
jgi:hypothetical protein